MLFRSNVQSGSVANAHSGDFVGKMLSCCYANEIGLSVSSFETANQASVPLGRIYFFLLVVVLAIGNHH
ncbi:MAG TPA: hypothetical protein DEF45_15475 [Rhodopirellula sp.]|nr:hypothetical protein [Rhodopirellula sp.]